MPIYDFAFCRNDAMDLKLLFLSEDRWDDQGLLLRLVKYSSYGDLKLEGGGFEAFGI